MHSIEISSLTTNSCAQFFFQNSIFKNLQKYIFCSCLTKLLKIPTVEQNDIKENW